MLPKNTRQYYVYGHYTKDTNKLFYIGKGTNKRAWTTKGRNEFWYEIVKKHDFTVEIFQDNLTEEQAYVVEEALITRLGIDNLENLTDPASYRKTINDPNFDERSNYYVDPYGDLTSEAHLKAHWDIRLRAIQKKINKQKEIAKEKPTYRRRPKIE